jgi:epoxyqueuosine reductase QueG
VAPASLRSKPELRRPGARSAICFTVTLPIKPVPTKPT